MTPAPDHLSATFSALADPTRRAILARLASGEAAVTELAKPFRMSLPAVSKHLKVLERAGLIARGREAQWRPCKIEANALKEVDDLLLRRDIKRRQRLIQNQELGTQREGAGDGDPLTLAAGKLEGIASHRIR